MTPDGGTLAPETKRGFLGAWPSVRMTNPGHVIPEDEDENTSRALDRIDGRLDEIDRVIAEATDRWSPTHEDVA